MHIVWKRIIVFLGVMARIIRSLIRQRTMFHLLTCELFSSTLHKGYCGEHAGYCREHAGPPARIYLARGPACSAMLRSCRFTFQMTWACHEPIWFPLFLLNPANALCPLFSALYCAAHQGITSACAIASLLLC